MANKQVAVITGTNSNLGVNTAFRLLETLPPLVHLTLVVTLRTLPRAREVIELIQKHALLLHRTGVLEFDYLLVDFAQMVLVLTAAWELQRKFARIDYFFANAAQGVYDGIDWWAATKQICALPVDGATNPHYKVQRVGVRLKDGLGLVFQANVFGPVYLLHRIMPLLEAAHGRVIWILSIMLQPEYLDLGDIQGLRSDALYELLKRVVDVLHLGTYERLARRGVTQYITHPGIFTLFLFFQFLNVFTYYGMMLMFYAVRWMGSPWHCISGYTAANAPIYAVFADPKTDLQKVKYGSAVTRGGREYVRRSEVEAAGVEEVVAYVDGLVAEWDDRLKDQITNSRE